MKVQVRTNSNRKLTGISHSCVISWLSEELFFLPHNQRLELSSWWSCSIIYRSLSISGITSYLSYACGTPPILVKGSHDPSVKSQRHFSILISTLCTGTSFKSFRYALSTADMSTTTTGQESSTCWSSTMRRRRRRRLNHEWSVN